MSDMSIIVTPLERLINILSKGVTTQFFIFLTYDAFRGNTSQINNLLPESNKLLLHLKLVTTSEELNPGARCVNLLSKYELLVCQKNTEENQQLKNYYYKMQN